MEGNKIHSSGPLFITLNDTKLFSASLDTLSIHSTIKINNGLASIGDGISVNLKCSVMASMGTNIVVASGSKVLLYKLKSQALLLIRTITQRQGDIRSIAIASDGTIAIGSDESDIHLFNIFNPDMSDCLKGHDNAVVGLGFEKDGKMLVSTSCDGTVKVWDRVCVHTIKDLVPTSIGGEVVFPVAWNSKKYAIGTTFGDVVIMNKDHSKWKTLGHKTKVDYLAWSVNGLYLACCSSDGTVTIWNVESETKVEIQKTFTVSSVAWAIDSNAIYLGDVNGEVWYQKDVIVDGPSPFKPITKASDKELFGDEDIDDLEINDMNDTGMFDMEADDVDDFVVDDDGAGYIEDMKTDAGYAEYQERSKRAGLAALDRKVEYSDAEEAMEVVQYEEPKIQGSFQPGSVPQKGNRNYLCLNSTGTVCVIENGETYTVDVDFHDATKRPFHFTETVKYTMGALNHNGCVLASVSTPTENSQVYFRQMDSWTSRNEWTVVMSDGESVVCVGVCGHGVVVATDYQYLRIFSPSGMQTGIKSMPGPVVTMCGYDSMLLVVYHIGGMYHQNASMGYQLIDMSTMKTIKTDVLCISPTTTLEWVGFTESGVPLTFDSAGVLRGLFVHSDAMWTPLFDSRLFRKTSSDWYFPVGATDSVMYCVVCRGDKVPSFPKPIIIDVPLSIPFCGLESERTVKEQKLLHHRLFLNEYRNDRDQQVELTAQRELEMDKIILPLFLAACKGQLSQRALELSFDLSNLKSLDGAIRVASNNHLQALTERLMTLKEVRLRELEDDDVSRVFEFKKEPVVEYEYTKTQEFEPVEPKRRKNPIAFKDDDDIIEQETPKVETVEKPVDEKKKKRNPFGTTKKEVVTVEANSCFDLIEPETNPVAEKVLEKKRKQTTLFDMVKQPVIVSFVNKDKKVKVVPVGYGISSSKETQEQQSILDHFSKDASQPMDADVDSEVKEVVVGKGKGIADPSLSLASFQYNKKEV